MWNMGKRTIMRFIDDPIDGQFYINTLPIEGDKKLELIFDVKTNKVVQISIVEDEFPCLTEGILRGIKRFHWY